MSDESDIISSLLLNPFNRRTEEEQRLILNKGRPTPNISCIQVGRDKSRTFKTTWYNTFKWLCGSVNKDGLFCWPCMLVSTKKNVWCDEGFRNWKNLSRSLERHMGSKEHIQNDISVKQLLKRAYNILEQLNDQARKFKIEHNIKVQKNREIFKQLIDLTCLLAKQGLAFRGHDEGENSFNQGNFKEIFHLLLHNNPQMKSHWEKMGAFTGLSKTIQNDIIDCVANEIKDSIHIAVKKAQFFSIQVDETTDRSEKAQCSVIIRFVDENGSINERFLGFNE